MDLSNRVIAITGATGLLGQAVTLALAAEGANLLLMGRNQDRLDQLSKKASLPVSRFFSHQVDLRNSDDVKNIAEIISSKLKKLDILIHLVGGWTGGQEIHNLEEQTVDDMIQQHFWTTFHLSKTLVPQMKTNNWGRIIVVSSPFARNPRAKGAAYAVGKAAQEALILTLAQELQGTGVTSNILLVKEIGHDRGGDKPSSVRKSSATTPDEIISALQFLISEEASMINGARIPLFGS